MDLIAKKAIVSGRVQGVFYRATTKDRALKINVKGYAKNLDDGTVEVLAIGEESSVDWLMEWLWTGSRASKVRNVVTSDVSNIDTKQYSGFVTQ